MKQNVIILQGEADSGKTTATGYIYQELLKHTKQPHTFDGIEVSVDSLRILNNVTQDFIAVIYINGFKIVIISAGDDYNELKKQIEKFRDFDILIVCARTRTSITYKELIERFKEIASTYTFPVIKSIGEQTIKEAKADVVKSVVEKVLELVK